MAEFVLKNWHGEEVVFDRDKIFVKNVNGELVQFTEGEGIKPVLATLEVSKNGIYNAVNVTGYDRVIVDVPNSVNEVLFNKTDFTGFAPNDEFNGLYTKTLNFGADIEEMIMYLGSQFSISWDGELYTLNVKDTHKIFEELDQGEWLIRDMYYLGNGSLLYDGLPDTGEPFAVQYTETKGLVLVSADTSETHNIAVMKRVRPQDGIDMMLQTLNITENGEYVPEIHYDGFSKVVVDVKGAGGGSLSAGVYLASSPIRPNGTYKQKRFMFKGELYLIRGNVVGSGNAKYIDKWNGSSWVTVVSDTTSAGGLCNKYIDISSCKCVEFNGKLHIFKGTGHIVFDGTSVTAKNNFPTSTCYPVVYKGKLCAGDNNKKFYEWDETTDTWTQVHTWTSYYDYPFVINDELYFYNSKVIYKYENGTLLEIGSLPTTMGANYMVLNGYLYYLYTSLSTHTVLYRFDPKTLEAKNLGEFPKFSEYLLSYNTNDISFTFGTTNVSNNSYAYNNPFVVLQVVEESE